VGTSEHGKQRERKRETSESGRRAREERKGAQETQRAKKRAEAEVTEKYQTNATRLGVTAEIKERVRKTVRKERRSERRRREGSTPRDQTRSARKLTGMW